MNTEDDNVLFTPSFVQEEIQSKSVAETLMETDKPAMIRCCLCSKLIDPNASNMCLTCLKGEMDIT